MRAPEKSFLWESFDDWCRKLRDGVSRGTVSIISKDVEC